MDRFLKIHNKIWFTYFILFLIAPWNYSVDAYTYLTTISLLFFGNIAFILGSRGYVGSPPIINNYTINNLNLNRIYKLLLLFSTIYIILIFIKWDDIFSSYGLDINFESAINLREQTQTNYVMGNNIYGVLSNIFSGFPIVFIMFFFKFRFQLTKKKKRLIFLISLIYVYTLFLSGGRNGVFLLIIISYFLHFIFKKLKRNQFYTLNSRQKLYVFTTFIFIFYLFGKIALDRADTNGILNTYISYLESTNSNELRDYSKELLYNSDIQLFYYPFYQFHDYFVQSFYQFEITLNNLPLSAPYYGQYNFSSFFLLFNKIGFNITTVSSILNEIVNPGTYFTLFGGLFLDFGFFGMFISVFIIYFLTGYFLKRFYQKQKFISLAWFIYFYIIIIMSPVYSVIGNSIYPGFLSALILISIFLKMSFFKKPNSINNIITT